jgi:copper oxidase (laccase) domain-containing protein
MAEAKLVFEKELPRGKFCVYQTQPDFALQSVKQTHSNIVLSETHCLQSKELLEADAIVGNSKFPIAVRTADCVPIVLLGENAHAIVHAGWRGLHNEILHHDLIQAIHPIYAFIGPHISAQNYEVQPDFRKNFTLPVAFAQINGVLTFNLSLVAHSQLERFYPGIKIEESTICTFDHLEMHSYRRNKTTERNWNVYIP